jgi:FKBP-type peptidyl-prolyl cis-trans isomerase FklB
MEIFHMIVVLMLALVLVTLPGPTAGDEELERHWAQLKKEGDAYMVEIAQKEGVIRLKTGVMVEIIKTSTKKEPLSPAPHGKCHMELIGTLRDGTEIQEKVLHEFSVAGLVDGLQQVVQYMVEGDRWKVYVPYALAYGDMGRLAYGNRGHEVPPYSPMIFEVEIVAFVNANAGKSAAAARRDFERAKAKQQEL